MLILSDYDENCCIERSGKNKPELRQKLILDKLMGKFKCVKPDIVLDKNELIELNVHDVDYLEFLEGAYKSFMELPDYDYMQKDGIVAHHFSARRCDGLPLWRNLGYYCDDTMTPIIERTFGMAMTSANNCFVAAREICEWDVVYCLNGSPGHHARRNGCSGYCFLNNANVCVEGLMRTGFKKIVVLDVDYHAGTLDVFGDDVLAISIHADPKFEYPTFSGHEFENGLMKHNIVFPKKACWKEYVICLEKACGMVRDFEADVIVVPFGADTFKNDPDPSKLYGCGLELNDYVEMGKIIGSLGKKVIVTQEGGYCVEMVPDIVNGFLEGLMMGEIKKGFL